MYQHFGLSVRSLAKSFSKSWKKRRKSTRARVRRDLFSCEALEERRVMAGTPSNDLVLFAQALTDAGVKFYGADWCPFCNQQKALFEEGASRLNFIEITNPDRTFNARAEEVRIDGQITMPTWVFADGSKLQGLRQLSELATKAGISIPQGVNPHVTVLDAANAAIADNATIKVKAGSPLWLPLDGYDPNGGPLTYEITSSNTNVVSATKGDPNAKWARINVQNMNSMLIYLFGSSNIANFPQVPRPVDQFTSIATSGAYDTTAAGTSLFHRVVDGFVIQAGIPGDPAKNDGDSGSLLPDFDDQFHVDLQHNRTGILSYAKQGDHQAGSGFVEGDYTNDSQWFITDGPTRSLDFNHSVFGLLVEGEGTRSTIDRTATNASDKPTNDIVITSIDILSSNAEDQVVMLKAAAGITSGTSQITVKVTDQDGNITTKVFTVSVEADDRNGSPFINDVPEQSSQQGTAKSVQLVVQDAEGETAPSNLQYTAQIVGSVPGATVNISNSGLLTVTPPTGFSGSIVVDANVKQVSPALTGSDTVDTTGDAQRITFNFAPSAPTSVDLVTGSDTGSSATDNITRASTLQFLVSGLQNNAQVKLFAGTQEIGTGTASGSTATISVNVNTVNLAAGSHVITAKQFVGDEPSASSPSITLVYDPTIADFDLSTPVPTTAEGNVPLQYDVENPDENQNGFLFELIDSPPSGMTIDASSGVISWTPAPNQVGNHSFKVRATDTAGNQKELPITLNVTAVRYAQFSLIATDLNGNAITTIQKGQEFFLVGRVEDLRGDAAGLEAAFVDVAFDSTFATVTGTIEHGSSYTTDTAGTAGNGTLDEVGGKTTATNLGGTVVTLFRVKMRADKTGSAVFTTNIAETHDSVVRTAGSSGNTTTLGAQHLSFTSLSLNVVPNFTVEDLEFNVNEDTNANTLDVIAELTVPSGDALTLVSVGVRNHGGNVTIEGNKLKYTPAANFVGEETFTYTVRNNAGDELTASITVEVANVNDQPTTTADTVTVAEDSNFTSINVLSNDSSAPDTGETLTIKSVSAGSKGGTIEIDASKTVVRYKPAANATGTETFTYTVQDGNGGEATGTVTVTITGVNDAPNAVDDTISVNQNASQQTLTVLANDTDADGNTLTVTAKTNPTNGTLVLESGVLKYTPNANFRGVDTFTYTISDGNGGTDTATVRVQVATNNAPPTATNDTVQTKVGKAIEIAPLANDSFAPDTGETLRILEFTQPDSAAGTVKRLPNGNLEFTPKAGFTGKATFTYTVADSLDATDVGTIEVNVLPITPSELAGVVFLDLNKNNRQDENEVGISGVTVTLTGKDQDGATVNKVVTTGVSGEYKFTDLKPGDYTVTETQPEFLTDGRATGGNMGTVTNSNAVSVKITVEGSQGRNINFTEQGRKPSFFKLYELFGSTPRNSVMAALQAGQATPSWVQVGEGWSDFQKVTLTLSSDKKVVTINATDENGNRLRGTADVTANGLTRIVGTEGTKSLVRLFGNPSDYNLQAVANTAPTFTKGDNRTVTEDSAKATVATWAKNISKGTTDEADQTITFTLTADKPELFEEQPSLSSDGTLSFKPKANANGVATVKIVAKDNGGTSNGGDDTSDEQTFTITITAVNDAPSFTKGPNQSVAENAAAQTVNNWATNLSKGPADEASQTLSFEVTNSNPALFQVAPAIDATGKLTYTVKQDTTGTATVTVKMKDSGGTANSGKDTSDAQTFTITVTGGNDPPVANNDTATSVEGSPATINVLANDNDPEGNTLTVTILSAPPAAQGTAVVNGDKTITFTPANNFSGTSTFTYQLADGQGGVASATVTVTVTNTNDAPVAVDDTATTNEDTVASIAVLTNDTDADTGDTLTVTATDPAHGSTQVNSQGVVTYTPDGNFNGTDTFTYTVSDGHGGTDTATVTVTVTSINDTPTISEPAVTPETEEGTDFVFTTDDGTEITIEDADAGTNDLEVELSVDSEEGVLSLGSTAGLQMITGDGVDDIQIVFRGTLDEILDALEGLTYTPDTGFVGTASIQVDVDDLGSVGTGGAKQSSVVIDVEVTEADAFAAAADDFMQGL